MTVAPNRTDRTEEPPFPARIALVGSPNVGKTSIFNHLTGLRAKTANYPGVTVARRHGSVDDVHIEDLPGAYSLQPISPDEQVVADILDGRLEGVDRPDALAVVVDAGTLSRGLTLVAQTLNTGLPVALVVTMTDELDARGGHLDIAALSDTLGVPAVAVVGTTGKGIGDLRGLLADHTAWSRPPFAPPMGGADDTGGHESWVAGVLEGAAYQAPGQDVRTHGIDRILLHPVLGTLAFFAIMFGFFQMIFTVAAPLQDLVETGVKALGDLARAGLGDGVLSGLVADGIIGGVGGVLVFIPQIVLLFLMIALMENVGYMSRAAFLMDRVMGRFGLDGRAFVSMLSSFACAIPGIMSTRSLPSARDRIATIMAAPLMTCSARLPVFILLVGLLVPDSARFGPFGAQGAVLFGLYLLGGFSAMIAAAAFKAVTRRGTDLPFYMELPPYRFPSFKTILLAIWDAAWAFIRRAGTIILATTVVLWALMNLPARTAETEGMDQSEAAAYVMDHSAAAAVGRGMEPVFAPLGFDWRINIGLLGSMAAREVFVATMGQAASAENPEDPAEALRSLTHDRGPKQGQKVFDGPTTAALLIYFVFALQCMSTIAAMRRETNSWRWPVLAFGYMFVLAWVGAFIARHLVILLT